MRKLTRRAATALTLAAVLSLALAPLGNVAIVEAAVMKAGKMVIGPEAARAATAAGTLEATIEVSNKGFNGGKGLIINAELGQEVKLTFVWADKAVPDNSHRILIKGYNIRTELLTPEKGSVTVSFAADKAGTFEIVCDWRCEGHDNLQGTFKVAGGEAVAATTGTTISMAGESGANGSVSLTAWLHEEGGSPVGNALVHFYVARDIGQLKGPAEVGAVVTDKDGKARVTFESTRTGSETGQAKFEGLGRYEPSSASFEVEVPGARVFRVEPKGIEPIRHWAPVVLLVVVAGVWLTIGYVVFNIYGVYRASANAPVEAPGGRRE